MAYLNRSVLRYHRLVVSLRTCTFQEVEVTILAVLTFWGFSFYINNFGNYNKIYGSIGTLIVLMIWLYLNSLIILIGFELNASIDLSKRSIKIVKPVYNSFKSPVAEEKFKKNQN